MRILVGGGSELVAAKIALVVISIILIAVILLQSGRSAGLGAITGGGNDQGTTRRGRGTDPILARATTIMAALFYIAAIFIAWLVTH